MTTSLVTRGLQTDADAPLLVCPERPDLAPIHQRELKAVISSLNNRYRKVAGLQTQSMDELIAVGKEWADLQKRTEFWKKQYRTWEAFCESLGISRVSVFYYIKIGRLYENVQAATPLNAFNENAQLPPMNRLIPLAGMEPEQQVEAFESLMHELAQDQQQADAEAAEADGPRPVPVATHRKHRPPDEALLAALVAAIVKIQRPKVAAIVPAGVPVVLEGDRAESGGVEVVWRREGGMTELTVRTWE